MSFPLNASPQKLQSAVTSGSGGYLLVKGQSQRTTLVLQGNGTISGGTIVIEQAYWDDGSPVYAGTWSVLPTPGTTGPTYLISASDLSGGAQKFIDIDFPVWAIRTRVVSSITGGGSFSSWGWAN